MENYEESLKAFDKALDKDPNNVQILNNKGEILYHVGMYHDSLLQFDKILQLEPGYGPALANKGSLLLRAGNAKEAIIYLDKALKLNSQNEYALHNKGIALYNTGKYREAIACLDKVIEINANSTMSYFFRGQSYMKLEDYPIALQDFKMIVDEDYHDTKHNSIGLCCYHLGLFEEAENAYHKVLEKNPSMIDAHYNLAVLYNERQKTKEAKAKLDACIKINKNFTKAKEAAQRLEDRSQLDWYGWWFGHGSSKSKKLFGFFLILAIFLFVLVAVSISSRESRLTEILVSTGLLVGILLLPSLRKMRLGDIEMETSHVEIRHVALEPSLVLIAEPVRVAWGNLYTSDSRVNKNPEKSNGGIT